VASTKFYHCSPKRFKKGDILVSPSAEEDHNYPGMGYAGVFVTISPIPHMTIWGDITRKWQVYEVSPIGRLSYGMWGDIICKRAIVLSRVGNAMGIMSNYKKTKKINARGGYSSNKEVYVTRKEWEKIKKEW
jgi:hypothetical protein